jgi:hypothetical protein
MSIIILPIVLIVLGGIGIVGTIWISSASFKSKETTIPRGSEWFSVSPDVLESELSLKAREGFRGALKVLLIWMISLYRRVSKEVTVKQVLKKKVRAFLYDHTPEGVRHPSEFWSRVRHHEKKPRRTKTVHTELETPTEIVDTPIEKEE